jgi:hypothetical protein
MREGLEKKRKSLPWGLFGFLSASQTFPIDMPRRRMPDAPRRLSHTLRVEAGLPQIHGSKPIPLRMVLDAENQEEAGGGL